MNTSTHSVRLFFIARLTFALLMCLPSSTYAQVPTMISYQGRVLMNNNNFSGTGQFKFALVQGVGPALLWKNDGSPGNTEPASFVSLPVANGLVMTVLGDTTLANMTSLPASVFANPDVRLRVWFNGGSGFQQLTPDQRIVSVGYALMAGGVPDGSITTPKLAPGVLSPANFPPNSVTSAQLSDDLDLGSPTALGKLDIFRTAAGTAAITLDGAASQISTFGSDGLEQIRLWGPGWGEILLHNSLPNNAIAVTLTAQGSTGGKLTLSNTNGSSRAILEGENTGGLLTLNTADGNVGAVLYGNEGQGSGALSLRNTNGSPRFRAFGGPASGLLQMYDNDGTETITANAGGNGSVVLRQGDGSSGAALFADNGTGGGGVTVYRDNGTFAGQLTVANSSQDDGYIGLANRAGSTRFYARASNGSDSQGGYAGLRNAAGTQTITLDADSGGDGRITTQVLTITGGSDFSENFDINAEKDQLKPGMIVSIDPKSPGELALSHEPYDNKVAGVVSGAGGVKPGMLMGQAGTKADGKHPVALTGRVYCWVDASQGAIEPGDMITSSSTPGHGMKAANRERAFGTIIGKAMTGLSEGKGLVLVLVNLQ